MIINNRLEPGSNSQIGPADGSGITARDIVFYANGINGSTGDLDANPKAAEIGTKNTVKANIYAPNGTIWINSHSDVEGAVIGKDVLVGTEVQIIQNSIFD